MTMNSWILISTLVSIALFVLPFKLPRAGVAASPPPRPRSLLHVFLREVRWHGGGPLGRIKLLRVGFGLSLLVIFLPPMMLAQFQQLAQQGGVGLRIVLILQAMALLLGCALTMISIAISDLTAGIGALVNKSKKTPVAALIPLYELLFALGSIIAAFTVG